jgi:hypothetical protein
MRQPLCPLSGQWWIMRGKSVSHYGQGESVNIQRTMEQAGDHSKSDIGRFVSEHVHAAGKLPTSFPGKEKSLLLMCLMLYDVWHHNTFALRSRPIGQQDFARVARNPQVYQ